MAHTVLLQLLKPNSLLITAESPRCACACTLHTHMHAWTHARAHTNNRANYYKGQGELNAHMLSTQLTFSVLTQSRPPDQDIATHCQEIKTTPPKTTTQHRLSLGETVFPWNPGLCPADRIKTNHSAPHYLNSSRSKRVQVTWSKDELLGHRPEQ